MATGKLNVRVGAELGELRREMKKANGIMGGFKKQMQGIGGVIAGAFAIGAIKNFTKESMRAYDVQAKAEASLLTALKGREDVQKRLLMQASQLQRTTLFGDEETIQAQSFLAQMGLSEQAITRLIPLVQDFATAQKIDLNSAAKLISKSVGSSTNALTRYGIEIEGAANSGARLESAIEALNEQVGGQSAAAAKVGTGAVTQLDNAWGDLKETFGSFANTGAGGVIPVLQNFIETVNLAFKSVEQLRAEVKLAGMSEGAQQAVTEFKNFAKRMEEVSGETQNLKELAKVHNDQLQVTIDHYMSIMDLDRVKALRAEQDAVNEYVSSLSSMNVMKAESIKLDKESQQSTPAFNAGPVQSMGAGGGQVGQLMAAQMSMVSTEMMSLEEMSQRIGKTITDLGPIFQEFAANGIGTLANALGEAADGAGNFGADILAMVGGFMQQLGQLMITTAIMTAKFKAIIIANPIAAIAAGAALVATGAYFAKKASGMASNMGGGGGSGGGTSRSPDVNSRSLGIRSRDEELKLTIEGKLRGADIEFALKKQERIRSVTGG